MSCNIYTPTVNDVCGKSKFKSTVENVTIEVKTDEFLVWYEVTYKYYNWDKGKPLVMFIGLNPSTANEDENDPTIRSVERISKHNGYGGFYMMNCFPYVSTDPKKLYDCSHSIHNEAWLKEIGSISKDIVFAWGNFEGVQKLGVDYILSNLFPQAKALHINKNGSPKHPLYCKTETKFVNWK